MVSGGETWAGRKVPEAAWAPATPDPYVISGALALLLSMHRYCGSLPVRLVSLRVTAVQRFLNPTLHPAPSSFRSPPRPQELRNLQVLLDRTQFEKSRMQRANDPLTAKYDALKKDIRQAGGAGVGVGVGGMHTPVGPGAGWGGSPTQQLHHQQHHGYPAAHAHVPGDAVVHAVRAPRGAGGQGR